MIDQRQRIGDWEVDTIFGKKHHQAVDSPTERKSRLVLLRKVDRRTAELVGDPMIELLHPVADRLHTIIGDNDIEFANSERITLELGIDFFFPHPYAARERGTHENMNGLVRQYIPEYRELNSVTNDELEKIISKLNHRTIGT